MKNKNFKRKTKFLIVTSILLIFGLNVISVTSQTLTPTVTITSKTNKTTYLLRQKITLTGNITIDGSPITNAFIILEITNPSNQPLLYETIIHGEPSQQLPIEITNIHLIDFNANPLNTVKAGTAVKVCVSVYNPQLTSRQVFIATTIYDANMVPLQVGSLTTTLQPQETVTPKFTMYIPTWAKSGKALITANVYTKEPKQGGLVCAIPKQTYYYLSRCQKGYLTLPETPLPQPQSTPRTYETTITLPPDPTPGTYQIKATCQINPTTFSATTTTFTVQKSSGYPPQASFIYWPATLYENMTIEFDASSSTAEGYNDTITSYTWNFGDGTPETTETTPTITHKYLNAGQYIITLNVTDNEGLWSTTTKPIEILPEFSPKANFTWTPQTPIINETITFDASNSTEGWSKTLGDFSPIINYTWNFGDGTGNVTVTTPQINHNFTQPGNYTVKLTITDTVNRQNTISTTVEVQNKTIKAYDFDDNGVIDMRDIRRVAKAFGSQPGDLNWDPVVDVNGDNKIDMRDIRAVAKNFGKDP